MSRTSWVSLVLLALVGCGDDDGGNTPDSGHDAATNDAGDGGFVPRRDSAVPVDDPIPACDGIDPLACGAGQKCAWVLRFTSATEAGVYLGCVDEQNEREPGVPCEQWGRTIEHPALTQDAYADPCVEGTFCAPDPTIRDVYTCQPLCQATSGCGQGMFCGATPISAELAVRICVPSDNCDALAQSGCDAPDSCYFRGNGSGDGPLAVCLPYTPRSPIIGEPGDPCVAEGSLYLSACQPGSVCWGDPRLPPAQWTAADIECRPLCDPEASDADAGFGCDVGECIWLGDPALGHDVSAISSVPGICG